jgi:hypothetical protein
MIPRQRGISVKAKSCLEGSVQIVRGGGTPLETEGGDGAGILRQKFQRWTTECGPQARITVPFG